MKNPNVKIAINWNWGKNGQTAVLFFNTVTGKLITYKEIAWGTGKVFLSLGVEVNEQTKEELRNK